jgi:hypothetical protein
VAVHDFHCSNLSIFLSDSQFSFPVTAISTNKHRDPLVIAVILTIFALGFVVSGFAHPTYFPESSLALDP